jgi:hypothetical protein
MPAEPMDVKARDRIMHALGRVVALDEEGANPDEAIAKAASASGLPREHIPLTVYAYNIGRTNRQRAEGTTLAEKAASFQLATTTGVYDAMFPEVPATKAASERAAGVDPVYERPPIRRTATAPIVKAAAAPAPKPAEPMDIRTAVIRREKRARVVAESRRMASAARDSFVNRIEKLASAFEVPGAPTLGDVRRNVEIRDGQMGLAILDHVAAVRPALAKQAKVAKNAYHAVTQYPAIYDNIAKAIGEGLATVEVAGWHAEMAKEAGRLDKVELAPFGPKPAPPATLIGQIDLELEKEAGLYDHAIDAAKTIHANDPSDVVNSALAQISSPEHEQQLRAIQARAMLHAMLNDDEILRGHDPYEVAHHYNRLSQFAPHLADKPLAAIPAVRQSVQQGQLNTFEAKELADTETKLRPVPQRGG